jgi:protoporphyrinogen oxidase
MKRKTAIIIGAGPAGLTAAYELLKRTEIIPIVLEEADYVGGISRTSTYRGNRIDVGGHRFFSKSSRVMDWWLERLPLQDIRIPMTFQPKDSPAGQRPAAPDPDRENRVMLLRPRKSRIYWRRKLFDYPLTLSWGTARGIGAWRMVRAGTSYLRSRLQPIRQENSLEDFLINRFGRELYRTFFKSYTEKVWGVPCHDIPADWGAQRVKGLSIAGALKHALARKRGADATQKTQKGIETSLIEWFLYPKYGPGQMWEVVADEVRQLGGQILLEHQVNAFVTEGNSMVGVEALHQPTGCRTRFDADFVFSSMPIIDLVRALDSGVPPAVRQVSDGLVYRDFVTVGLLVDALKLEPDRGDSMIRDNWIYIQEPDVSIGRLQIFNNWSPYLIADPSKVWLGLEYFCSEGDELWSRPDADFVDLGVSELGKIDVISSQAAIDGCVIRMRKTYPAYFGRMAGSPRSDGTWTGLTTCSALAETVNTATTIRTIRCFRRWWRSTTSWPATRTNRMCGTSTRKKNTMKPIAQGPRADGDARDDV